MLIQKRCVQQDLKGRKVVTATQVAKQCAKTYRSIRTVRDLAKGKLDALLTSQPFYKLFEYDATHPYFTQVERAEKFVEHFEALSSILLCVDFLNGTLSDELEKIQAAMMLKASVKDDNIEALQQLPMSKGDEIQAATLADRLLDVYECATWLWSFSDLKSTNAQLEVLHGKKAVSMHLEAPFVNISVECRAAFSDVKKLAGMLLALNVRGRAIRSVLENKRTFQLLQSGVKSPILDALLSVKDAT